MQPGVLHAHASHADRAAQYSPTTLDNTKSHGKQMSQHVCSKYRPLHSVSWKGKTLSIRETGQNTSGCGFIQELLQSIALHKRPSIRERHLPACSCLWLVCATGQGSGRCLQQASHVTKARRVNAHSLHAHSSNCHKNSLPFFPGFSSPSLSYHSLHITNLRGAAQALGV